MFDKDFFQDFKVARDYIEVFGTESLSLFHESPQLRDLTSKVRSVPSIAVHVRRGDYLKYRESFGVLSDEYFLDAISKMREIIEFKKVYIFTDSPGMLTKLLDGIDQPTEVIVPEDLSPSETLVLLSRFEGIALSNSTFSFWAAALSTHKNVLAPEPWFRSSDDWLSSASLMNPDWESVQAKWLRN